MTAVLCYWRQRWLPQWVGGREGGKGLPPSLYVRPLFWQKALVLHVEVVVLTNVKSPSLKTFVGVANQRPQVRCPATP